MVDSNTSGVKKAKSFDPLIARAFGDVVRSRRNIAQDALALKISIDRSYLGKLERGECQPSLTHILKIADGLNITASELIADVEVHLQTLRRNKDNI